MLKLIKGGKVYNPKDLGKKDILIAGSKILKVADHIDPPAGLDTEIIDASGMNVIPGIIDGHVHILGAGGTVGPNSRNSMLHLSTIARAGVTTLIGVVGVESLGNTMKDLYIRARALEMDGITTYTYSGSFELPVPTITGDILEDLCLIDKVIGIKIAINDAMSCHPTKKDLKEIISKTRRGGKFGAKAGVVDCHLGEAPGTLMFVVELLEEMGLPKEMFVATHVNRCPEVFEYSIEAGLKGLSLDLTGNVSNEEMIPASQALRMLLDSGVPMSQITFSSDANTPFEYKDYKGTSPISVCAKELKKMVEENGFTLTEALQPLTTNPAARYKLENAKGSLDAGKDADVVLLDKNLQVSTVIARGAVLLQDGVPLARGRYEDVMRKSLE